MHIRPAEACDLDRILAIYAHARAFMRETGNPTQWGDIHPMEALIRSDIEAGVNYVLEDENGIHGVFALIAGADPSYAVIRGAWLNDEPYCTLHRVASDGTVHGVLDEAVRFALTKCSNLRIDTHANNRVMQRCIDRCGFTRCGIVTVGDGTDRIAYQLSI